MGAEDNVRKELKKPTSRRVVVANAILDCLKARTFPVKTDTLVRMVRKSGSYTSLIINNVLADLEDAGAIYHRPENTMNRWKILNREWDRENPFKSYQHATPVDAGFDDGWKVIDAVDSTEDDEPEATEPVAAKNYFVQDKDQNNHLLQMESLIAIMAQQIQALSDFSVNATKDIEDLRKQIEGAAGGVRTLTIQKYDGKVIKLKDKVFPKVFDKVRALASCRRNILLVGPAGCGKTYLAKLVADSLDLGYGSISCTSGMSEAHLLGRAVPDLTHGKNRFQGTEFLDRYENGGVMLLDELDAADSNLLLSINTGLANNYLNVPNRTEKLRADRHKDFVCIGTANTFGRGASRVYAGRNQLDESTLDRFRVGLVEMDYDRGVEAAVCPNINLRSWCHTTRDKIERTGLRRIMSTRFMEDAAVMMQHGWSLEDIKATYFSGWSPEEAAKVR